MTLVLGIESSCDETAAAVVSCAPDGTQTIRSNIVASQAELHEPYGGVVPEIASRAHVEKLSPVLKRALTEAHITASDLDAVAVGHRPGLIGSLLVGVAAAKAIAWSTGAALVGVDHVRAHLHAALMTEPAASDSANYPALGLVVSGGHTSMYAITSPTELTRLGSTIDDAMGEAYDKVAAILGLPYPGGPAVDALAREHDPAATGIDPVTLPVPTLGKESLDFSFSGLKTAALYAARGVPRPKRHGGGFPRDAADLSPAARSAIAAGFQAAACRAAIIKLERAFDAMAGQGTPPKALLAGGGVAANSRLRTELAALADRRGVPLRIPPLALCVDNAAMIAGLGAMMYAAGYADDLTLTPVPTTAC